jgi:uncharacterized SAM-binding protein YcdF (DUF218 family)
VAATAYYAISKLVWFVLEPTNLLLVLALAGGWLWQRGRPAGRRIALLAVTLLAAAGFLPLSNLLLAPLEQRFAAYRHDGSPVAGVIVLGGGVDIQLTAARSMLTLNDAGDRITAMLDLHRRYPESQMVYAGGPGEIGSSQTEASALEGALREWTPRMRVIFERQSRNTVENAQYVRALVAPKPGERWLLVTSAWHMPRSVGIFRKAGFEVIAYPVDYRTTAGAADAIPFYSASNGLRRTDFAMREWVGLVFAYITGRSSALFPAP